MINLNIRELFYSYPGEQVTYDVPLPIFEDPEFEINPNQTMRLIGYKIDDGVCIATSTQKISGNATCTSCLKKFKLRIAPYPTERQFYLKRPEEVEDAMIGSVNTKTYEVDIEEILREGVFLGLPPILRCTPDCHKEHHEVEVDQIGLANSQPFKNLKDLIE